jgi:phosphoribosylanthranilate isomerase
MWVKVCGICNVEDAVRAVKLGYDAIGLNFVESSNRRITPALAREIALAVRPRAEIIGVVANLSVREMLELARDVGLDALQLHGDEPPDDVERLGPPHYKAVRVATAEDVSRAGQYTGDRLLVDAKVKGVLGGSGQTFDWGLVTELARQRRIVLAGGLHAENVTRAVQGVQPWGVDVASGVEASGQVRHKSASKMADFIEQARQAAKGSRASRSP